MRRADGWQTLERSPTVLTSPTDTAHHVPRPAPPISATSCSSPVGQELHHRGAARQALIQVVDAKLLEQPFWLDPSDPHRMAAMGDASARSAPAQEPGRGRRHRPDPDAVGQIDLDHARPGLEA